MKKTLFYLFGLLSCFGAVSQNVSIELSIHWQLERDVFNEDSIVNTPMLNTTYRNNRDESIYFKKISLPDNAGLPQTVGNISLNLPPEMRNNWRRLAEISLELSRLNVGNNYIVEIGDFLSASGSWFVYNEAEACEVCEDYEMEMDWINNDISRIHDYIFQKQRRIDRVKTQFRRGNLSENNIIGANRKHFVFLQPNETYTETFNIVAFQLVKGNFTFGIKEDTIPDYVGVEFIWDEFQKMWIEQTAKLPEKVGEYRLYSGSFHTNAVKVSFK